MTTHTLKLPEPYFSAVLSGEKTFEVRRNDRGFQRGDTLVLQDTTRCDCGQAECARRRPSIVRYVTFAFSGDPNLRDLGGVVPGYVVLGLGHPDDQFEQPTGSAERGSDDG